jgi:hypothetical protein
MNASISFQAVVEHFKRNRWNFQADESHLMLHTSFQTSNGTVRCGVAVDNTDDLIQAVSFLPFAAPPERRLAAGELCVRLSSNLKVGRFDLNYETGEVRFHTSNLYPKGELTDQVISRLIGTTLATLDRHFLAFTAVLYANALPAVAAVQAGAGPGKAVTPATPPQLEVRPRINLN